MADKPVSTNGVMSVAHCEVLRADCRVGQRWIWGLILALSLSITGYSVHALAERDERLNAHETRLTRVETVIESLDPWLRRVEQRQDAILQELKRQ